MIESKNSLKFKVGAYVIVALTITVLVFALVLVHNNRDALLQQVISNSAQLSRVVMSSTRFAMHQNKPYEVDQIISDVAAQPEIEKVRVLSKSGTIMHSSQADEVGKQVDQEAEACLGCHLDEKSFKESPLIGRSRFFNSPDGRRMLGATAVIRNEPSCAGSGCHKDQAEQAVLGVLDIVTPLDDIEATLRSNTYTVFGLSFGFILLAGFLVSFLVHRVIFLPLRDLEKGAERLAEGDLDNKIPVRSKDEFGQLATSFNSMTDALRASYVDLENWGHTLEQKVKEARRELEIAHTETARSEKLASVGRSACRRYRARTQ